MPHGTRGQASPIKVALVLRRVAEATGVPVTVLAGEVARRRGDREHYRTELSDMAYAQIKRICGHRNGGYLINELVGLQEYIGELETLAGMDGSEAVIRSRESEAAVFQAAWKHCRKVRLLLRQEVAAEDFGDQAAGKVWEWLRSMIGKTAWGEVPADAGFPSGEVAADAFGWLCLDVGPLWRFRWEEHAENLRALRIRRKCAEISFSLREQTTDPELFAATLATGLVEVRQLKPISAADLYQRARE